MLGSRVISRLFSEPLARTAGSSGDVYFVPAFSGLYAPYWRSDARGIICGLTQFTTKAHLAYAALEAVCYQTKEVALAVPYFRSEMIRAGRNRAHGLFESESSMRVPSFMTSYK